MRLRRRWRRRAGRAVPLSSTSRLTKALPMPRARMKVSLPRLGLLVAAHVLDQPGGVPVAAVVAADRAQPHRQADGAEMAAHALGIGRRAKAEPRRKVEGHRHAGADRLAVQQVAAEAGLGLQRMAEGVAEIEQRAQVGGLALVGRHDARLGQAALLDGVGPLGRRRPTAPRRRWPRTRRRSRDRRSGRTWRPRHSPPATRAAAGCRARRCRPAPGAAGRRRRPGSCRGAC